MKKLSYFILICMLLMVGCKANDVDVSSFDDTDVVAIVRGEEITIGDLRFLYEDDQILEKLDGTIKAKLVEQEVKRLNIDLSQKLQEMQESKGLYFYSSEENDDEFFIECRKFIEAQSSKLGMDPEEYYEEFFDKSLKLTLNIEAYIEEKLGQPNDNVEEYMKKANELLDQLVKDHKGEIRKHIK